MVILTGVSLLLETKHKNIENRIKTGKQSNIHFFKVIIYFFMVLGRIFFFINSAYVHFLDIFSTVYWSILTYNP